MSASQSLVDFIVDQNEGTNNITYKKMFGGYTLYCRNKIVALVCDDQLFVKPTEGGRTFIGEVVESPPYPGAKNCFLIDDNMEDSDWLRELFRITTKEVPQRKPKKRK